MSSPNKPRVSVREKATRDFTQFLDEFCSNQENRKNLLTILNETDDENEAKTILDYVKKETVKIMVDELELRLWQRQFSAPTSPTTWKKNVSEYQAPRER